MRSTFRLARAAVVAGATVFLAAGAHSASGGSLPDPLIMMGVLALVALPVMALSGRRISAPAMLAVLGAGQFALHNAFAVLSVSSTSAPTLAPGAGHVHVVGTIAGAPGAAHHHADSSPMLMAHMVATALTALLLAYGEAALWALLAWLQPLVRLLAALVLHPAAAVPTFIEEAHPRAWRGLRLPAWRGPPSPAAVA